MSLRAGRSINASRIGCVAPMGKYHRRGRIAIRRPCPAGLQFIGAIVNRRLRLLACLLCGLTVAPTRSADDLQALALVVALFGLLLALTVMLGAPIA